MAHSAKRTDPELWEEVKKKIIESGNGGRKGQWSARKAQLAVQEYRKRGGGYEGEKSTDNSLRQWTEEDWGTKSGRKGTDTGERYLPKHAREALSEEEYARTTRNKREDTEKGKQFSSQPKDVQWKTARYRHSGDDEPAKAERYDEAKRRDIEGRSKMSKAELAKALGR
jgi:hypothetical protein